MVTKKIIHQNLTKLKIDNSISISDAEMDLKVNLLFDSCKSMTDEQFTKATNQIIMEGVELYGKLPKAALFLEKAGEKPQDITSIAKMQVAKILIEADHFFGGNYKFENPVTNATVKRYGGLCKLNFDLFDNSNDKPKQKEWVAKDLLEIWLQCHDGKIYDDKPTILDPATKRIEIFKIENKKLLTINKGKK